MNEPATSMAPLFADVPDQLNCCTRRFCGHSPERNPAPYRRPRFAARGSIADKWAMRESAKLLFLRRGNRQLGIANGGRLAVGGWVSGSESRSICLSQPNVP